MSMHPGGHNTDTSRARQAELESLGVPARFLMPPLSPVDIVGGLTGRWRPVRVSAGYVLSVIATAVAIALLPLLYLALVGSVGFLTYLHFVRDWDLVAGVRGGRGPLVAITLYVLLGCVGLTLLWVLLRPLLWRTWGGVRPIVLDPHEEPRLYAFVQMVCRTIGAPPPKAIQIVPDVNASASFRRPWLSLVVPGDLVLTIGAPLLAGLNTRELAGVLAHEFGHFTQGAGMRANWLITTVISWLERAALSSRVWDARWSDEAPENRRNLLVLLVRLGLAISRAIIRVLFYMGMGAGTSMLRQMEYDADAHEIRFSGSRAFDSTCESMALLSLTMELAVEEAQRSWRRRELPDDLMALMIDARDHLSPEMRDRFLERRRNEKLPWYSTHPSDSQRRLQARRMDEPGIFELEAPSTVLFNDFADLSKRVTKAYYRGVLFGYLDGATLLDTAKMLAPRAKEQRQREIMRAYLGFEPPTYRPPTLAPRHLTPPDDANKALAKLKVARASLIQGAQAAREAADVYRRHSEHVITCAQAASIFSLGIRKLPPSIQVSVRSAREAMDEIVKSRGLASNAAAELGRHLEAAEVRLGIALRLMMVKGMEARVPDVAARRARAMELGRAYIVLGEVLPMVMRVREEFAKVAAWSEGVITANHHAAAAAEKLRPIADEIRTTLDDIRRAGGGVPYPFAEIEHTNLGERLVGGTAGWRDYDEIFALASHCVRRFGEDVGRCLAALCELAWDFEQALGFKARAAGVGQDATA